MDLDEKNLTYLGSWYLYECMQFGADPNKNLDSSEFECEFMRETLAGVCALSSALLVIYLHYSLI